jgi:RNA polymerase sigma-70 factor (ECF subfamily)
VDADPDAMTTLHVRQAMRGDPASREWLVARLTPLLAAQARWRLGPVLRRHCEPDDLVQDAWLTVLPRLGELPPRDGRYTPVLLRFLATTILNRVNNLARKQLRGSLGGAETPLHGLALDRSGVLTAAMRNEERSRVLEAIDGLEERDREILLLRGVEQRTNAVVAELLGIRPEAAVMRYSRALRRLRELLPGSVFSELPD